MKAPHLPFSRRFNDNKTLGSYARGIYDYYDVEQIEEFLAFRRTCEIASFIEECDTTLYKSENFAILNYFYDNYASNPYTKPYIEDSSAIQEETNILQESIVMPSMRLYLPRVEARLRGITVLKAMSQVR